VRIAFLTYAYGLQEFGTGKFSWNLKKALESLGVSVDIFTTNFRVLNLGPLLLMANNAVLDFRKYDVVHSNEGAGFLVTHPNIVETYHHDYSRLGIRYSAFGLFEYYQCKRAKHVIVPSYATKQALLRKGLDSEKVSVIYHGVSDIFTSNRLIREKTRNEYQINESFVVISVGRLVRHKRQIDIVKALSGIQNAVLILVGKGECLPDILDLAKKQSLRILHFESIPEPLLVQLLNASDVYVHVSEIEGFGLSVVEAMACGLPVIAYSTGDFQQIIAKDLGFLLRQGDRAALRDSILFLINNPDLRDRLGARAISKASEFNWNKAALRHLELYRSITMCE
jgi:glycosyltransferase involved in cell wall biosynthesis